MPRVEFEPTIPVFERVKTVHSLDHAATVIGLVFIPRWEIQTYLYRRFLQYVCLHGVCCTLVPRVDALYQHSSQNFGVKRCTTPWRHMGGRKYSSTILDLNTRWRWAVSSYGRFNSGEGALGTLEVRWVPEANWTLRRSETSCSRQEYIDHWSYSPSPYRLSYPGSPFSLSIPSFWWVLEPEKGHQDQLSLGHNNILIGSVTGNAAVHETWISRHTLMHRQWDPRLY
jgi:hypothetical protein